ncbi:hypothetical protein FOA52_012958 [Chlamydomonas sp. UWO 241]|nr:hypothetical protein FOA52_012958 [Chlamydomonas sp. UWO 241]
MDNDHDVMGASGSDLGVGDSGNAAREAWRQARQMISEYEARASEMALDVEMAQQELRAMQDKSSVVKKQISQLRTARKRADATHLWELSRAQELRRQLTSACSDTQRLAHQLTAARDRLAASKAQQEASKVRLEEHLNAMKAHVKNVTDHASTEPQAAASDAVEV